MKIAKYGFVTVLNYIIIISGTYLLVEVLGYSPEWSYFFVISGVYIFTYIVYTVFVFKANFNKKIVLRFIIAMVLFWALNNLFFSLMIETFDLQYMLAALSNILFLGLVRFFVYKNLVFKDGK